MTALKRKPYPKKRIVFVCTGNTCRSPMAEALMKRYLTQKRKKSRYEVLSYGLNACEGEPMSANAAAALRRLGVKGFAHTAALLTPSAAQTADLIVCMTGAHAKALERFGGKVTTVSALTGGESVPDPFGQDEETYLACAKYLQYACADVLAAAERLCGSGSSEH